VQEFLAAHGRDDVTERLNQVYSNSPSGLDPALSEMQDKSLKDAHGNSTR